MNQKFCIKKNFVLVILLIIGLLSYLSYTGRLSDIRASVSSYAKDRTRASLMKNKYPLIYDNFKKAIDQYYKNHPSITRNTASELDIIEQTIKAYETFNNQYKVFSDTPKIIVEEAKKILEMKNYNITGGLSEIGFINDIKRKLEDASIENRLLELLAISVGCFKKPGTTNPEVFVMTYLDNGNIRDPKVITTNYYVSAQPSIKRRIDQTALVAKLSERFINDTGNSISYHLTRFKSILFPDDRGSASRNTDTWGVEDISFDFDNRSEYFDNFPDKSNQKWEYNPDYNGYYQCRKVTNWNDYLNQAIAKYDNSGYCQITNNWLGKKVFSNNTPCVLVYFGCNFYADQLALRKPGEVGYNPKTVNFTLLYDDNGNIPGFLMPDIYEPKNWESREGTHDLGSIGYYLSISSNNDTITVTYFDTALNQKINIIPIELTLGP